MRRPSRASTSFVLALRVAVLRVDPAAAPALTGTYPETRQHSEPGPGTTAKP
jgi:hypothetical protein